jgi:hypothetical protein
MRLGGDARISLHPYNHTPIHSYTAYAHTEFVKKVSFGGADDDNDGVSNPMTNGSMANGDGFSDALGQARNAKQAMQSR